MAHPHRNEKRQPTPATLATAARSASQTGSTATDFMESQQKRKGQPVCGTPPLLCFFSRADRSLGTTIDSWKQEVAAMWRFSKNNGITEGFHNKMEMIARRAYGFRNVNNYRTQVRVMCS
jgi:hypothetical protein